MDLIGKKSIFQRLIRLKKKKIMIFHTILSKIFLQKNIQMMKYIALFIKKNIMKN